MDPKDVSTGERIEALMNLSRLNKTTLAAKIGKSRPAIHRWISEDAVIDSNSLVKLAEVFQTSTDYILTGREPRNPRVVHIERAQEPDIKGFNRPVLPWGMISGYLSGDNECSDLPMRPVPEGLAGERSFWVHVDDPYIGSMPVFILLDPDRIVRSGSMCLVRQENSRMRIRRVADNYGEFTLADSDEAVEIIACAVRGIHDFV